ncbi:hypothetical protein V8E36_000097 [Tilletia maclaganii]
MCFTICFGHAPSLLPTAGPSLPTAKLYHGTSPPQALARFAPLPSLTLTTTAVGPVAEQCAEDAANARALITFDPDKIEDVIRDGRIDSPCRKAVIDVMCNDPVFSKLKSVSPT